MVENQRPKSKGRGQLNKLTASLRRHLGKDRGVGIQVSSKQAFAALLDRRRFLRGSREDVASVERIKLFSLLNAVPETLGACVVRPDKIRQKIQSFLLPIIKGLRIKFRVYYMPPCLYQVIKSLPGIHGVPHNLVAGFPVKQLLDTFG